MGRGMIDGLWSSCSFVLWVGVFGFLLVVLVWVGVFEIKVPERHSCSLIAAITVTYICDFGKSSPHRTLP